VDQEEIKRISFLNHQVEVKVLMDLVMRDIHRLRKMVIPLIVIEDFQISL
jgi:hypothetical protein